jgi:hypothetical protein
MSSPAAPLHREILTALDDLLALPAWEGSSRDRLLRRSLEAIRADLSAGLSASDARDRAFRQTP